MNWLNWLKTLNLENVDWTRVWRVLAALGVFWAGLTGLTFVWPAFDMWFKVINYILGACVATALFLARSTKYVVNRQEPPQDGKP